MKNDNLIAFVLFKVGALGSVDVVDLLQEKYQEVVEAAAVYSDIDVIALIEGSQVRIGEILLELLQESIPIKGLTESYDLDSIFPYLIDGELEWSNSQNGWKDDRSLYAYVVIDFDQKQRAYTKIIEDLMLINGVVYSAKLKNKPKILVKMQTSSKMIFDEIVMVELQSIRGVTSTRSHIIINRIHEIKWSDNHLNRHRTVISKKDQDDHLFQIKLVTLLNDRFNMEELRNLCFHLKVDIDDLPANGKINKVRELITYLERRDRLDELVNIGKTIRPDINSWEL